jgi:hypothetical protein
MFFAGSVTLQMKILNECFTTFRERGPEEGIRWVMFTDLDEFVLSSVPIETLSDTLNAKYKGEACFRSRGLGMDRRFTIGGRGFSH